MQSLYDLDFFLDSVSGLSKDEIIVKASEKITYLENISYGKKGAVKAREYGSAELISSLRHLLGFLQSGSKNNIPDYIFYKFKPIVQNLVNKNEINKEILNLFP